MNPTLNKDQVCNCPAFHMGNCTKETLEVRPYGFWSIEKHMLKNHGIMPWAYDEPKTDIHFSDLWNSIKDLGHGCWDALAQKLKKIWPKKQ